MEALLLVCILLQPFSATRAWMPPHPNATIKFESVHEMRRRLNKGFNYTTRFVDAEMCRYLTEEECEESDERMKEHAEAHKKLTRMTRSNPSLGRINVSLDNARKIVLIGSVYLFMLARARSLPKRCLLVCK